MDPWYEVDLTDPASYRVWHSHVLRFADVDAVGHVNNVAYAEVFESGRVAFGEAAGVERSGPGRTFMIVKLTITYLAQMDFPGAVEVGTRVLRVGTTSSTFGQGLFKDGVCTATSEAVCALVDRATNRSTPIPEPIRSQLLGAAGT